MKLVPVTRPVTILSLRDTQQWISFLFRHTDHTLLLYHNNGLDCSYSPMHRWRSLDHGKTWSSDVDNVPRLAWTHSFGDGELFEIDTYGFSDNKTPDTLFLPGAWSRPNDPSSPVRAGRVTVHSPSIALCNMEVMQTGYYPVVPYSYPINPWRPFIHDLFGRWTKPPFSDIFTSGPNFTSMIEHQGKLLGLGYWLHKADLDPKKKDNLISSPFSIFLYESSDRGHTWTEKATVARGTPDKPEGYNEATLVALKDGRLYSVYRSGQRLYHGWSSDSGKTWTPPCPFTSPDYDRKPAHAWPVCKVWDDGSLVLAYGRPGMHLLADPTGTGTGWQGHLDLTAWERQTQSFMGVPDELLMREDINMGQLAPEPLSSEYLSINPIGPRELLVSYDVHYFFETWNSHPVDGVRMLKVRLDS